ncbi:MAG: SGNH/GDSL hydrolase family protein [Planctomycetota bacterium]
MASPSISTRVAVATTTLSVTLAAVCVFLGMRAARGGSFSTQAALNDPSIRDEVIERLLSSNQGIFDSHPDPDVGRILQPNLRDVEFVGYPVRSNSLGLREGKVELPKPEGRVRVVLLGDSFIFGYGAAQNARVGVHLEQMLKKRTQAGEREIEVLHFGVGSWNAIAEAEYVRRQLSLLDPDTVIQILVSNDLDDNASIRGFGARASFSSQARDRADAMVSGGHSTPHWGRGNHLPAALGWEGQSRFRSAGEHVTRLAAEVERRGASYLLVGYWAGLNGVFERELGDVVPTEQRALISRAFYSDVETRLSKSDPHWNEEGHRRIARLLYALIHERELLPALELEPWQRAEQELAAEGTKVANELNGRDLANRKAAVRAGLDFSKMDAAKGEQVLGGVDGAGLVGPYGSLLLRRGQGTKVRVVGRFLDRPEIDGGRVTVFADETEIGELRIESGTPINALFELPADTTEREFLALRFRSDDYCYVGPKLRQCVSFQLEKVLVEP